MVTDIQELNLVYSLVHVKKVEIFGFKSFGFKNTTVQFEPGLVSISGPNGSGKSNILDAIIFAMGENKPRMMRVGNLRMLIHDIDGNRRTPKIARSSVHFDNTDRKIPVDSDTVEITREMDEKGENVYYLNKKKTNRSHILNLLDLANAGLGQLNAVQQGTVTKISEMSSEEKRVTIETMLGLAYFDQKKENALKELADADRRLEIAQAKMGEIKKRVTELEEERNQKLQYDYIQKEITRYRAIDAAGKLKATLFEKSSKEAALNDAHGNIAKLSKEKEDLDLQIQKLEDEKSAIMEDADRYNHAKSKIDIELSESRKEYESARAIITTSSKRIQQAESGLLRINTELQGNAQLRDEIVGKIKEVQRELDDTTSRRDKIKESLTRVDSRRQKILSAQSETAVKKSQVDQKIKALNDELNAAKLSLAENQNKMRNIEDKIQSNGSRGDTLKQDISKLAGYKTQLDNMINNHNEAIATLRTRLAEFKSKKTQILGHIEESQSLLEQTSRAANQYESKMKTVEGFMHEDYTVAKLKEDAAKLGILGLVYDVISWDKRYERAILAVSSDWLKAIVVRDFTTLLMVAEFARVKNLPKLKIIPLEAIPKFSLDMPNIPGILGVMSDYVRCDSHYNELKRFLFGNIILADSKETALAVSKAGYKAASIDGAFFEASGGTVVIDINSKLSKLTKLISMSVHVDGLFTSIKNIKKYMARKKSSLKTLEQQIQVTVDRMSISEKHQISSSEQLSTLESRISSAHATEKQLRARVYNLEKSLSDVFTDMHKQKSHIDSLVDSIRIVEENYSEAEQTRIANELETINTEKIAIEDDHTKIMNKYREDSARYSTLQNEYKEKGSRADKLLEEKSSLLDEIKEYEGNIQNSEDTEQAVQKLLEELRQKEQDLILSDGASIGNIKEYDARLKILGEKYKSVESTINQLQRQSDSLGRDLKDIAGREVELQQILSAFKFDKDFEAFEVESIIRGLEAECESLDALNAKAPETYLEVARGYGAWSPRKNMLENERNTIVKFIESMDRDKKQTFLDGFDKVDKEIRTIFSKMTGGNAWLELQNEDDIFNSGISYLIQFPKKPKRESISISGGEKTLAAIVFVLALQKLKPSPFYLFDEVDAHLDAPNSERLAKILSERSKESQFIMVSLKDSVVQKARLIYGVYPKNGVSNVVTYKDRKAIANAKSG